jgi:hypothetical protein
MSILFYSAEPEIWEVHFDNSDWMVYGGGAWSTDRWISNGTSNIYLAKLGTWYIDYRPTYLRVTHTDPGGVNLYLARDHGSIITSNPYVSGTILGPLDFSAGEDIDGLQMQGTVSDWECTNIEFLP